MSKQRRLGAVHGLVLLGAALAMAVPAATASAKTRSCERLASLHFPETTITAAQVVPAGDFTPPGSGTLTGLPEFCRVTLTVAPAINIEVWLPTSTWNERYQGVGGGGYAGRISYSALAGAIREGYASASTDTGHVGGSGNFAFNADGTLNDGLIEDFASRSLHEMVLKAKRLIKAFYGSKPRFSYWTGCSTGGRQGLMAVQRFPEEYDGLVIAAPAINWERFIAAELWPQIVMFEDLGGPISNAKLNAVTAAAVAACDPLDEVTDGVINDPRKCTYDPAQSVCPAGDPATCLTDAEANAVRKIWDGPRSMSTGNRVWFGLEPGASFGGLANEFFVFPIAVDHAEWVFEDPAFDWHTIMQADYEEYQDLSHAKFNQVIGTDDVHLRSLRNGRTKVLMWHGEADQLIFPRGTINYYLRVIQANESRRHKVADFMRFFLAPGVAHCAGGDGPNPVGLLDQVVDWVENGNAPERVLAVKTLADGTERSRPLCPYPMTAAWDGVGDTDDASSFICVDGQHDVDDFQVDGEVF